MFNVIIYSIAPASGGSDDWAKETLGVKYVYLVELRPQQRSKSFLSAFESNNKIKLNTISVSNGFILRQEELLPTAIETFEAIKVIIQAVLQENSLPSPPLTAISMYIIKKDIFIGNFCPDRDQIQLILSRKTMDSIYMWY